MILNVSIDSFCVREKQIDFVLDIVIKLTVIKYCDCAAATDQGRGFFVRLRKEFNIILNINPSWPLILMAFANDFKKLPKEIIGTFGKK